MSRVGLRSPAVLGGFLASALIGVLEALYGPLIPAFRATFDLGPPEAGLILTAHFGGVMLGTLAWGATEVRASVRLRLGLAGLLLTVGCLGVAAAPAWPYALGAALLLGLGFGLLDTGLNTWFAAGFGPRSPAMVNLLNAAFSVGAIASPLAVALAPDLGFRPLFLACGLAGATFMPALLTWGEPAAGVARPRPAALSFSLRPLLPFVALFALTAGLEAGVGGWSTTHLLAIGYDERSAALGTGLFWVGLAAGRFLAAPLSLRLAPERLVIASLGLAGLGLALALAPPLALGAYGLVGLALAPVFGTGLAWLLRALPTARSATAAVMAGGGLGSALLPPLVGSAIAACGAAVVPAAMLVPALVALLLAFGLRRVGGT